MLQTMGDRLQHLHVHDAFLLLRHSIAMSRLLHILRSSPCFSLLRYPNMTQYSDVTSSLININLQDDDSAWLQASLLVNLGGLVIRSVGQLAPSAFLASAAASSSLANLILPSQLHIIPYSIVDEALLHWEQSHVQPTPPLDASHRQKAWDLPRVEAAVQSLTSNAPDARCRVRLLTATSKESGAWLNVLPVSSLGLLMDDESIHVGVGLCLGVPLCQPHLCHQCGAEVDHLATHELSCRRSIGHHSRHATLNDIIHRALTTAKIPSRLEPSGLYRSDGKRPDGASLVPWKRGKVLVWDATCEDTFATSYVSKATREAGLVAKHAEERKQAKYRHLVSSHIFVLVAVDTSGIFSTEALKFVKDLGHRLQQSTVEPKAGLYLLQRLSVAIQQGSAAAVLGTFPEVPN